MKGCYLLVIDNDSDKRLRIGKKGIMTFPHGVYVYVGSAFGCLEQRIQRHLRIEKKTYWHIDYFLKHTSIHSVFYKESTRREECTTATRFKEVLSPIAGFGCSDCSCKSHLFYGTSQEISQVARSLQMKRYRF